MTQTAPRPTAAHPAAAAPSSGAVGSSAQDGATKPASAASSMVSETATTTAPQWKLGKHFMLRVGGLPVDAVHGLRYPNVVSWADDMLDAEDFVRRERPAVLADLGTAVGRLAADEQREVIWLRRQLNADKIPADRARADRAIALLDDETARRTRSYLMQKAMISGRMRDAAALIAQDGAAARDRLRELGGDPRLRAGLLLASPTLNSYVDSYLQSGPKVDKRGRRVERSLLEYLYRMACKSTPFSRFTGVGLGSFGEPDDEAPEDGTVSLTSSWLSYPRINVSLLTRIGALITEHPTLRKDVGLALTPGWRVHGDSVRYVRRSVRTGSTEKTVSFDTINDSMFVLQNSAVLNRIFEVFDSEKLITWNDLTRELVLSEGGDRENFDSYLSTLTRLGLLQVPALAIDIHSGDPLEAFYRSVSTLGPRIARLVTPGLSDILDAIDRYDRADVEKRAALLGNIRTAFADIAAKLDAPDEEIPKTVLFEDVRVDSDDIAWDERAWRASIGESLELFERLLPAFTITLAHRLVLKGFFLARYGVGARCDDLLKLVNDFNEDIFEQYIMVSTVRRAFEPDGTYLTQVNWLRQGEIEALDRARTRFAAQLRRRYEAVPPDAAELELDETFIDGITSEIAELREDVAPLSHFLQMGCTEERTIAVLNRSYGGLRFPFSRFTHCFEDLDGGSLSRQLRASLTAIEPTDAVFAEVTGGQASTNLNLHGRLVDREIICPGEWSSAPRKRQIEFEDLYVEHDAGQDRLVLREKRSGREILPVYLGYLVPIALSDVPRTLLLFSQSSTILFDPWSGVPTRDDAAVVSRPRLRVGNLVVSRRNWTVAAAHVPTRRKDQSEADWFLGWRRWQREHALPDQLFARVHNPAGEDEQVGDYALARMDKPQYVDFDSPLSLQLLEHRMSGELTTIIFEEALPDEDGLYVRSKEGRHVAEMVVETASIGRAVKSHPAEHTLATAQETLQ